MTDIVVRLRQWAENDMRVENVCLTAADEIERLREEVKSLRGECRELENAINRMLND